MMDGGDGGGGCGLRRRDPLQEPPGQAQPRRRGPHPQPTHVVENPGPKFEACGPASFSYTESRPVRDGRGRGPAKWRARQLCQPVPPAYPQDACPGPPRAGGCFWAAETRTGLASGGKANSTMDGMGSRDILGKKGARLEARSVRGASRDTNLSRRRRASTLTGTSGSFRDGPAAGALEC
jgi:hypothetical protein